MAENKTPPDQGGVSLFGKLGSLAAKGISAIGLAFGFGRGVGAKPKDATTPPAPQPKSEPTPEQPSPNHEGKPHSEPKADSEPAPTSSGDAAPVAPSQPSPSKPTPKASGSPAPVSDAAPVAPSLPSKPTPFQSPTRPTADDLDRPDTSSPYSKFMLGKDAYSGFKSSNVAAAKYDPKEDRLKIGFKNGGWYRYENVHPMEAKSFYDAGSKGKWVWDKLRLRGTVFGYQKTYKYLGDESEGYTPKYAHTKKHRNEHRTIGPEGMTPLAWREGKGPYHPEYGVPKPGIKHPWGESPEEIETRPGQRKRRSANDQLQDAFKSEPKHRKSQAANEELQAAFGSEKEHRQKQKEQQKPAPPAPRELPAVIPIRGKGKADVFKRPPKGPQGGIGGGDGGGGLSIWGKVKNAAKKAAGFGALMGAVFGQHKEKGGDVERQGGIGGEVVYATPGERVFDRETAQKNLPLLESINQDGLQAKSESKPDNGLPVDSVEGLQGVPDGGSVAHQRGDGGDTEPVKAKDGAFVVNKDASVKHKDTLDAIAHNKGEKGGLLSAATKIRDDSSREKNFRKWFGDSKVVDSDGKPKTVYHGSKSNFDAFDPNRTRDIGIHFGTTDQADYFSMGEHGNEKGGMNYAVNLAAKNPLRMHDVFSRADYSLSDAQILLNQALQNGVNAKKDDSGKANFHQLTEDDRKSLGEFAKKNDTKSFWKYAQSVIEDEGYDSIVYQNDIEGKGDSYAVFHPTQIKSAIANEGTYDQKDPRIHKARGGKIRSSNPLPLRRSMGGGIAAAELYRTVGDKKFDRGGLKQDGKRRQSMSVDDYAKRLESKPRFNQMSLDEFGKANPHLPESAVKAAHLHAITNAREQSKNLEGKEAQEKLGPLYDVPKHASLEHFGLTSKWMEEDSEAEEKAGVSSPLQDQGGTPTVFGAKDDESQANKSNEGLTALAEKFKRADSRKPKSKGAAKALYQIVQDMGGISMGSLDAHGFDTKAYRESNLGGLFRKNGGRDISEIAGQLHNEGHINLPDVEYHGTGGDAGKQRQKTLQKDAAEHVMELLRKKTQSLHVSVDDDLKREEKKHFKEQEDAKRFGFTPSDIEPPAGASEEDSYVAGEKGDAYEGPDRVAEEDEFPWEREKREQREAELAKWRDEPNPWDVPEPKPVEAKPKSEVAGIPSPIQGQGGIADPMAIESQPKKREITPDMRAGSLWNSATANGKKAFLGGNPNQNVDVPGGEPEGLSKMEWEHLSDEMKQTAMKHMGFPATEKESKTNPAGSRADAERESAELRANRGMADSGYSAGNGQEVEKTQEKVKGATVAPLESPSAKVESSPVASFAELQKQRRSQLMSDESRSELRDLLKQREARLKAEGVAISDSKPKAQPPKEETQAEKMARWRKESLELKERLRKEDPKTYDVKPEWANLFEGKMHGRPSEAKKRADAEKKASGQAHGEQSATGSTKARWPGGVASHLPEVQPPIHGESSGNDISGVRGRTPENTPQKPKENEENARSAPANQLSEPASGWFGDQPDYGVEPSGLEDVAESLDRPNATTATVDSPKRQQSNPKTVSGQTGTNLPRSGGGGIKPPKKRPTAASEDDDDDDEQSGIGGWFGRVSSRAMEMGGNALEGIGNSAMAAASKIGGVLPSFVGGEESPKRRRPSRPKQPVPPVPPNDDEQESANAPGDASNQQEQQPAQRKRPIELMLQGGMAGALASAMSGGGFKEVIGSYLSGSGGVTGALGRTMAGTTRQDLHEESLARHAKYRGGGLGGGESGGGGANAELMLAAKELREAAKELRGGGVGQDASPFNLGDDNRGVADVVPGFHDTQGTYGVEGETYGVTTPTAESAPMATPAPSAGLNVGQLLGIGGSGGGPPPVPPIPPTGLPVPGPAVAGPAAGTGGMAAMGGPAGIAIAAGVAVFSKIAEVGEKVVDVFVGLTKAAMDPAGTLRGLAAPIQSQVGHYNPGIIERFNLALDNASAAVGSIFAPVIEGMREFADEINVITTGMGPGLRDMVTSVIPMVRDGMRGGLQGFSHALRAVTEAITPIFNQLRSANIGGVIAEIFRQVGSSVGGVVEVFRSMYGVANGLWSAFGGGPSVVTSLVDSLRTLAATVSALSDVMRSAKQRLDGFRDRVHDGAAGIRDRVMASVRNARDTAASYVPEGVRNAFSRLREGADQFRDQVREGVANLPGIRLFNERFNVAWNRMNDNRPETGPRTIAAQQARHIGIEDVGMEARRSAFSQGSNVQQDTANNTAQSAATLRQIQQLLSGAFPGIAQAVNNAQLAFNAGDGGGGGD